jgi:hypothetical protein
MGSPVHGPLLSLRLQLKGLRSVLGRQQAPQKHPLALGRFVPL